MNDTDVNDTEIVDSIEILADDGPTDPSAEVMHVRFTADKLVLKVGMRHGRLVRLYPRVRVPKGWRRHVRRAKALGVRP